MRSLVTGLFKVRKGTGGVGAPPKWSARAEAKLRALPSEKKLAVLVLTAVILYGGFIALDGLGVRHWLNSSFGPTPDLHIYQERTMLILNGGILYRDMDIEAPPLINYFLLPPQLLGGEWWAYEAYFSMFPLLVSLTIYLVMRRWDDYYAFLAAWVFIVCPFALQDATWGLEDEPLVAFFYLLPVLLFLRGYGRTAGVMAAVGFWTKFLPVIQYPVLLIKTAGRREKLINLGWTVLASLLIMFPFLMTAPIEFLNFPSYYLLGRTGEGSAGMSLIYLISQGGLYIDGTIGAALTIGVLALSYYLVYRWNLDVWRGAMLTTVMFLSIYPMIRLGYFIMPFAFFVIWVVRDKKMAVRLALMFATLLFGQGLAAGAAGTAPDLEYSWSWFIALLLVLAGILLMLDIARTCLRTKCFLDRETREGGEGSPSSA